MRLRGAWCLLMLGWSFGAHAQERGTVQLAVTEIMGVMPEMRCDPPEVWQVRDGPEAAAEQLLLKVRERGWSLVDQGSTSHAYAFIVDPDPFDPDAVAIGGLILGEGLRPTNTIFLANCRLSEEIVEGPYARVPAASPTSS